MKKILLAVLLLALAAAPAAQAQTDSLGPAPADMTADSIIGRYLHFCGGLEKLAKLKSVAMTFQAKVGASLFEMNTFKKDASRYAMTFDLLESAGPSQGLLDNNLYTRKSVQQQVFDGEKATLADLNGQRQLDGTALEEFKFKALIIPELHYAEFGFRAELLYLAQVGDRTAYKLRVISPTGAISFSYFDLEEGQLLRKVETVGGFEDPTTVTTSYADYRRVKDYFFPHSITQLTGDLSMVLTATEIKPDAMLIPTLFQIKEAR